MSRRTHQEPRYVRAAWPELAAFLGAVAHGKNDRRPGDDLQVEIAKRSLEERQAIAREWWDWNKTAAANYDVRFAVEALNSSVLFSEAKLARDFMSELYDQLIVSIRSEAGKDWKP